MLCVFLSFFPHTLFPLLSFLSFHSHSLSYSLRDTQQTHPECKKGFSLKKSHLVISCLCDVIWPIMSQANQINEVYQGLTIRPVPLRHRVAIKEVLMCWLTGHDALRERRGETQGESREEVCLWCIVVERFRSVTCSCGSSTPTSWVWHAVKICIWVFYYKLFWRKVSSKWTDVNADHISFCETTWQYFNKRRESKKNDR